jgi:hypothetical protein
MKYLRTPARVMKAEQTHRSCRLGATFTSRQAGLPKPHASRVAKSLAIYQRGELPLIATPDHRKHTIVQRSVSKSMPSLFWPLTLTTITVGSGNESPISSRGSATEVLYRTILS